MRTSTSGQGRPKGVPNKATVEIQQKLAALGCDPLAGMAALAADPKSSPELKGKMLAELAQYVAPKRKAVEVTGNEGGPIEVVVEDNRPPIETYLSEFKEGS